jgi:NADH-quinone oxidoreductase subunit M
MLWLYQRTMFGKLDNPENARLKDLDLREIATLAPIVVLCFWIGLYPKPFFDILDRPVADLAARLEASDPGRLAAASGAGAPVGVAAAPRAAAPRAGMPAGVGEAAVPGAVPAPGTPAALASRAVVSGAVEEPPAP